MSDRCSLSIFVVPEHREQFVSVLGIGEPDESEDDRIDFEEVSYGASVALIDAANAGLSFEAVNGAGGSYGPGSFVAFGGDYAEVHLDESGTVLVAFDVETGEAEEFSAANARKWARLRDQVFAE